MKHFHFLRLATLLIAFWSGTKASAQFAADSLKHTYAALPDALFPTDMLADQSLLKHLFSGTEQDPEFYPGDLPGKMLSARDFPILYQSLYYSQRLSANGLLPGNKPPHLMAYATFEGFDSAAAVSADVPLYLFWHRLNTLAEHALDSGYFQFDGTQFLLMDSTLVLDPITGASISMGDPMQRALVGVTSFESFLGGTNFPVHYTNSGSITLRFTLPSSHIQSNLPTADEYQVDFADGQGFQRVRPDQTYSITYTSNATGPRSETFALRIRARKGSTTRESRFKVVLVFNAPDADLVKNTNQLPDPPCLPAEDHGKPARMSVRYAKGRSKIERPVILVEGFESTTRAYGDLTFTSVASGYTYNSMGERVHEQMEKLAWVYDSLYLNGYDIIHVDFRKSQQSIFKNAQNLLRVLHWVEGQQPKESATLIGASMGGLIARVALNRLQEAGCCMPIAAFGTFDSPHDGAFIPLGLQKLTKTIAEDLPMLPAATRPWHKALDSEAAREMLIEHLDPGAAKDRAALLDALGSELPKGLRLFAIVNGSDLAHSFTLADPQKRYVQGGWHKQLPVSHAVGNSADSIAFNFVGHRQQVVVWGTNTMAHSHKTPWLFEGSSAMNIIRLARIEWYATSRAFLASAMYGYSKLPLPYSTVVGQRIVPVQLATNLKLAQWHGIVNQSKNRISDQLYHPDLEESSGSWSSTASAFSILTTFQVYSPSHTFIPSYSALDMGMSYLNSNLRGEMKRIPFHTYYAPGVIADQTSIPEEHIATSKELVHWVLGTLRGIYSGPGSVITADYNLAKVANNWAPYPSQLGGVTVASGVQLTLGKSGPVGLAGSSQTADAAQKLAFFVGGACKKSVLTVNGTLTIGDGSDRVAVLNVLEGSDLVLSAGSVLKISNQSQLRIAKGARLIIHPGAVIEWTQGRIEWEGEMHLASGANFAPTGAGQLFVNGGTLKAPNGGEFTLSDAQFHLQTTIELPASLTSASFDQVSFHLESASSLLSHCPSLIENSQLHYLGLKTWKGIFLGAGTATVRNSTFNGGSPALQSSAQCALSISGSTFMDAFEGISMSGNPVQFSQNTFYHCEVGATISGKSYTVDHCDFNQCATGLVIQGGDDVKLDKNSFSANTDTGVKIQRATVRATCNEFLMNPVGMFIARGNLKMGNNAANSFRLNQTAVWGQQLNDLQLNHGHNSFAANGNYDLLVDFANQANLGGSILAHFNAWTSPLHSQLQQSGQSLSLVYNPSQLPTSGLCPSKQLIGKSASSDLNPQIPATTLQLYPNPSKDPWVELRLAASEQPSTIWVFDIHGGLVHREEVSEGTSNVQLDLGQLVPGTYVLRWERAEGMQTARWIYLGR